MDYDNAVEAIKKAEAYDVAPRTVMVNLVDFEDSMKVKEYSSRETASLMSYLDRVGLGQVLEAKGQQQKPAQQKKAAAPSAAPAKPYAAPQAPMQQYTAPQPSVQTQQPTPPAQSPKPRTNIFKGLEGAAAELADAVSHAEKGIAQVYERKPASDLVLPTLSLNDQLSELEKINLALDGNLFDNEQLGIVKTESLGLARSLRKGKPSQDYQKELVELRDKRLKEVLDKLGLKA